MEMPGPPLAKTTDDRENPGGMKREPTRILVVANRTAAAPQLLDEVERRARAGPCRFSLLVPDVPTGRTPDWTLETALPLLERVARAPVDGLVGGPDPFEAVQRAVADGDFEEIIVSTLPRRVSKWLRRDLVRRIQELGLPVTPIIPGEPAPAFDASVEAMVAMQRRASLDAGRQKGGRHPTPPE